MERLMQKLSLGLLLGLLLIGGSSASAMVCGGGYSSTESNHTSLEHACYEWYFNNAGVTLSSGNPVVFDMNGTGVNGITETSEGVAGAAKSQFDVNASDGDVTNLGTYIELTSTADDGGIAGVIDENTCADQTYCRVQVRGPRTVLCADSSDAVTVSTLVGTSTLPGQCGDSGAGEGSLGVALESGDATNEDPIMVWIRVGAGP